MAFATSVHTGVICAVLTHAASDGEANDQSRIFVVGGIVSTVVALIVVVGSVVPSIVISLTIVVRVFTGRIILVLVDVGVLVLVIVLTEGPARGSERGDRRRAKAGRGGAPRYPNCQ
jgi:hypothetical protein